MFFSLKMNVVRFINWILVMSDFCKKTGNPFRNIYSSADHQTYKHDSKPFFFFFFKCCFSIFYGIKLDKK